MRLTEDQANDLLDAMREHGWSETGPNYDPVRWLRLTLVEESEEVERLEQELRETRRDGDKLQEDLEMVERQLAEARAELNARDDAAMEKREATSPAVPG